MLFELCQLVRNFVGIPALFAVLQPKQIKRDAILLQFPMDVFIVRHFATGTAPVAGKQKLLQLFVVQILRQRVTNTLFLCDVSCAVFIRRIIQCQ